MSFRFPTTISVAARSSAPSGNEPNCHKQVVGQRSRDFDRKCSNEGLSNSSKLEAVRKPGVEIILEVAAKVDLIERVFFYPLTFRRDFRRTAVAVAFTPRALIESLRLVLDFFEHRVLNHLAVEHFLQLQLVEREDAHHLHQAGRQHLPLRDFYVQPGLQKQIGTLPSYAALCLPRLSGPIRLARFVQIYSASGSHTASNVHR